MLKIASVQPSDLNRFNGLKSCHGIKIAAIELPFLTAQSLFARFFDHDYHIRDHSQWHHKGQHNR